MVVDQDARTPARDDAGGIEQPGGSRFETINATAIAGAVTTKSSG
jgi:hypothetical protein